jgi:putative intracellular protease/amidase
MSKGKVLVIGSNATEIEVKGGGTRKIGQYLNETVVPIWAVQNAGYETVLVTPNGTQPHLDETALSAQNFENNEATFRRAEAFFADDPSMTRVRTLRSVIDEGLEAYAAVFVPGGHAPVVDLIANADAGEILQYFHARRKPTAMICHGPITLVAAMPAAREFRTAMIAGDTAKATKLAKGWQYAGYNMTIYSNSETKPVEDQLWHAKMLFHVVDALQAAGGKVSVGAVDFDPHVVEDRELITGQNPRSDHQVGAALVRALDRIMTRA